MSSKLAAWLCVALASAQAQAVQDPVLAQVITVVKARALSASRVDWPATQAEADRRFAVTGDETGRTDAIRYVLAQLDDHHSSYLPPAGSDPGGNDLAVISAPPDDTPAIAAADRTRLGFGRLVIRSWTGAPDAVPAATRLVRVALNAALAHDACGLVLDVSADEGGSMWPMMGGIAPLYDEGALQVFEGRDGPAQVVNVHGGWLRMNQVVYPQIDNLPAMAAAPRYIALVVGRRTASAGEMFALGFRGQRNVRSFGVATRGATTANATIALANGGLLALSAGRVRDRAGHVQEGAIEPEVVTREPLAEADAWLEAQCR